MKETFYVTSGKSKHITEQSDSTMSLYQGGHILDQFLHLISVITVLWAL